MNILIITQVIDTEHPILGFFHRWVEEFAKHCEHVHVIALQVGTYNLPDNVTVHSLGKDEGKGRLTYLVRFYKLIWSLRHEYDSIFVHMNQMYVILGALFWRLMGKKISLWYTHGSVTNSLRLAERMTNKVFTASKDSFKIESEKLIVTGHGIDTETFASVPSEKSIDIITVGRISSAKNLVTLVQMLKKLQRERVINLTIVGSAVTDQEQQYEKQLKEEIKTLAIGGQVSLAGKVLQADLPTLLNKAKIFVTVAQNGSLDKVMLEAMSCGLPIVSMAKGSASLPIGPGQVITAREAIKEIKRIIDDAECAHDDYVAYVKETHSLTSLIPKFFRD